MRILVANTPRMYREAVALAAHLHNPDFEVRMANPAFLHGEVERFRPHMLIRDDDGITVGSPEGVVGWSGIIIDDHLRARVSLDGWVSGIHEISLHELHEALDETAKFVSANGIR